MTWSLDSAEARAREAPRSFFIPPAELRHSLGVGDVVKLIFCLERDDGEVAVERMWVEVVETAPYIGVLVNEPQLSGVIEYGDRVAFGPEHVCGYAYTREELGYDLDLRCFLLRRVADAEGPPPLLVFTEDGDWEAHARDESADELEDTDNVLMWTLGYLTDRFPETAAALREGRPGGWWEWDGARYVPVGG
jgi:uncharacterized protein YegJ (DUF2314 family)